MERENRRYDRMKTFNLEQIKGAAKELSTLIQSIEEGFKLYSEGKVVIPPVGHMHFNSPPGNLHIKYGHIPGEKYFVVKIASHFPNNPIQELAAIDGVILLFCQKTGEPVALFEDRGYLTHLRTGIAGAIIARYFAPKKITSIGIVGAGTQARIQLKCLEEVLPCRKVMVWARNIEEAEKYASDPLLKNFHITIAKDLNELTQSCNYIVTTTPSHSPLLFANQIRPGTHITALGADSPGKQELDPQILGKADLIVVDSQSQCKAYSETHFALEQSIINPDQIHEIGEVIAGLSAKRTSDQQITVADLTGLAIQDLKIAEGVFSILSQ